MKGLKACAEDVKKTIDGEKFKAGQKKLQAKPEKNSRDAYRTVFGVPPFNDKEWKQWQQWAKKEKY